MPFVVGVLENLQIAFFFFLLFNYTYVYAVSESNNYHTRENKTVKIINYKSFLSTGLSEINILIYFSFQIILQLSLNIDIFSTIS